VIEFSEEEERGNERKFKKNRSNFPRFVGKHRFVEIQTAQPNSSKASTKTSPCPGTVQSCFYQA
jgi:hypothetical protein